MRSIVFPYTYHTSNLEKVCQMQKKGGGRTKTARPPLGVSQSPIGQQQDECYPNGTTQ